MYSQDRIRVVCSYF